HVHHIRENLIRPRLERDHYLAGSVRIWNAVLRQNLFALWNILFDYPSRAVGRVILAEIFVLRDETERLLDADLPVQSPRVWACVARDHGRPRSDGVKKEHQSEQRRRSADGNRHRERNEWKTGNEEPGADVSEVGGEDQHSGREQVPPGFVP